MIARECMQLCTSENIEFKYTYPPTCRLITAHAYYAYYPGSLIVHEVPAWCWIMDVLQSLRYLCRYPGLHCLLFRKIWFIEIRYCLWLYTLPNLVHYCNRVAPSCTLASFPGLHRFYLPFAFTIIHGSDLPIPCIVVNANGTSKQGRPGTEVSCTSNNDKFETNTIISIR